MRMESRLRKLEQTPSLVFGREVVFPGLSQEDAEREARAMVERGEIAADDFVLGIRAWPLGPVRIRRLPCTTAEYCAWLDTLPEPDRNETRRNAT
jgi:hypothetical protein